MKRIKKVILVISVIVLVLTSCSIDETSRGKNIAPKIENQTFSTESNIDETTVIGTIEANDENNDVLTFSITNSDNNLFELTKEGELTIAQNQSFDIVDPENFEIVVTVSDGELMASATISISVTVND